VIRQGYKGFIAIFNSNIRDFNYRGCKLRD
jgi:hypothetical protein